MNKFILPVVLCWSSGICAQQVITGRVVDEHTGQPLAMVTVTIRNTEHVALTNEKGLFTVTTTERSGTLLFSRADLMSAEVGFSSPLRSELRVQMAGKIKEIEEVVVSTGYQRIPKERATGSFSSVSAELLQKQVGVNALERLSASANAVFFNKGLSQNSAKLTVRGLSTIKGPSAPLIVLDNFPYEGDVANINPDHIESITILKDAAAASIWGARAANGVIVITTKQASVGGQGSLNFHTSLTVGPKPDLSYLRFMNSSDFIDVEKELFARGYYNSAINSPLHPVISPVVNLLHKVKTGSISQEEADRTLAVLAQQDVRDEYRRYMYRPLENKHYSVTASGGSKTHAWAGLLGYDDNSSNLDEKYQRINMNINNTWKPLSDLAVTAGVAFNESASRSGRSAYGTVIVKNQGLPYLRFADDDGSALPVWRQFNQEYLESLGQGKLLDWSYYPLTDWQHAVSKGRNTELVLNGSARYRVTTGLEAELRYQHFRRKGLSETLSDEESYYTRFLINNFTVLNDDGSLSYQIPRGSIKAVSLSESNINNFRGQLTYNATWGKHQLSALAGGETRSANTTYQSNRYFGFNPENLSFGTVDYNFAYPVLTGGTRYVDQTDTLNELNNNFVSAYANASYTYHNKYILSGSLRRDASNLFGLNTNDQWNPFWSAGIAWNVAKEDFYRVAWLPELKFRASFGFNGNIDPSMVAVTTIAYAGSLSPYTNGPMAQFSNYYNPGLKWESVRTWNIAADFSSRNKRLAGSVELYQKKGENLFGTAPMDYTTGIDALVWNVAGMKGRGFDAQLRTINIDRAFRWSSTFNISGYKDEVIKYYLSNTFGRQFLLPTVPISGVEGLPVYSVFAYKWAGLDPQTGDPRGYLDGEVSTNYAKITGTGTDVKDLEYFGSAIPTLYGNLSNTFSYKNFSLDIGLSYKINYYFRRASVNYTALYSEWIGHSDYTRRWQQPGDEIFTNVPSSLFKNNVNRDNFYAGSSVLIEKGDHIRLNYINLAYRLDARNLGLPAVKHIEIYANAAELGLLWQASKSGIDPDYNLGNDTLKPVPTLTLGLRANF